MTRVLLVNMPFAALDSPSLALGLFKSRLLQEGTPCDVQHLNFTFAEMVGYDNYEFMLRLPAILGGEQLFARSVFGSWLPSDREYYQEILASQAAQPDILARLELIRQFVPAFLQKCLDSVPWRAYDIIGFTSLFEQNLAGLALAQLLKQRYPEKKIVFGGANCEQIMGITLHRCFPFIDYVCSGEADESFPELVNRLKYHHPIDGLRGVVYRENGKSVYNGSAALMENLDGLTVPDYDEYFERLESSPLRQWINPALLMESARGCWWGEKSHCTFCGLNGLTMAFRTKTVERTLREIAHLLSRYPVHIVRFVDNILAPNYFKDLLPQIACRQFKADYICEVKSNLKKFQIKALADAGVTVQAGIENLSTHVLSLMAKGSNSLMNIQTLKWCRQYGVMADWNLIYGFPGEVPQDYLINLELAQMLTHLHPPSGCGSIRLDRFSPNFDASEKHGITNVRPMKFYKYLYPFDTRTLSDLIYYFDFDYQEEIDDAGCVPALENVVASWKLRRDNLSVERTDQGLVIHDSRPVVTWPETIITGIAARVYEYCDRAQTFARIREFVMQSGDSDCGEEEISRILEEFLRLKLMVREGNRYLSLGVLTFESDFEIREAGLASAGATPAVEDVLTTPLVHLQPSAGLS